MSDLIQRAGISRATIRDRHLREWQRIDRARSAFSGLEVRNIPAHTRDMIERGFCAINALFSRLRFETPQDCSAMEPEHDREVLDRVASVCLVLLRAN